MPSLTIKTPDGDFTAYVARPAAAAAALARRIAGRPTDAIPATPT